MLARLQRALLVALLCILPVQSMAATLIPLTCSPQDVHHALPGGHAAHDHAAQVHGGGSPVSTDHDHDGPTESHGHLCCHQFSSAAPAVPFVPSPNDFGMHTASVSLLTPLHIPELPQRPPRA